MAWNSRDGTKFTTWNSTDGTNLWREIVGMEESFRPGRVTLQIVHQKTSLDCNFKYKVQPSHLTDKMMRRNEKEPQSN